VTAESQSAPLAGDHHLAHRGLILTRLQQFPLEFSNLSQFT
jgi:hypothetical protein